VHSHYIAFSAPHLNLQTLSTVGNLGYKSTPILAAAEGLPLTGELAALVLFMTAFIAT
tara:strand:- start:41 stop:214 length:174 start_codon:yes stop_codon:yes gene_type:complete